MLKTLASLIGFLTVFGLCQVAARVHSDETVNITIPSFLAFAVNDVSVDTTSSDPFTVTFDSAALSSGHSLKISVESDTTNFSSVGGDALPASLVKWSIDSASGGTGSPGTLSTTFQPVFQSDATPTSGSAALTWKMSAPGASGVKAGDHNLTLTWKIESL